jgi:alcohol dehydrogenase class IV
MAQMNFEFATANRIVFGNGAVQRLPEAIKNAGAAVLLVTGKNPARAERVKRLVESAGKRAVIFSVDGEPELTTIEAGTKLAAAEGCDTVVSCGGGSVIDAGKAIAAMMTNEGELLDYVEIIGRGKALTQLPAMFIAIPTTAGTGSEVTRNAVLSSPEHKLKVSLRSALMLPQIAIVDPELTYDLPPEITASTGLDALTQLIEPYVCSRANPMTDGWCLEGIARAARSLRIAVQDGKNKTARADMSLAGLFGGLALANAGLGAVHGFAGPIGGMYAAPHGAICAILLPHVMAANIGALRERDARGVALSRYTHIAKILMSNPQATADDGVLWVAKLVTDLRIPKLRTYGVQPEQIPDIVAKAANASSMKANPVTLTPEELSAILRAAL